MECLVVQTAVPALASIGAGERDMLPRICPGDLVTFLLHISDEGLPAISILQSLVDGVDQIQFPAVAAKASLILSGLHPFLFSVLLWLLQNAQAMGGADLIIGLAVLQQIVGALVELFPVLNADAVDHQVVMNVVGI